MDVDPDQYKPDKTMQQMVKQAMEPYKSKLSEVIGFSTTPLMRYFVLETPIDNLITDALLWKFKPDIALSNGFRFCQPLAPDPKTGKATITREFLWNMLPVNSQARTAPVTGKQLQEWLEKELQNAFAKNPANRFGGWFVRYAGMEVVFTIGNEVGKRVQQVKIGGHPLQLEKSYSIVACERDGDPSDTLCRIEKVANPHNLDFDLHAVMEEYLARFSPVSPRQEGRAIATDQPATLLTQLQGTTYEFR
jgi:2',3'-cyclic-nucleotide 2'-phosphodiesterase (5'-nucleotidase family)